MRMLLAHPATATELNTAIDSRRLESLMAPSSSGDAGSRKMVASES
jgi:hypothetical protein